MAKVITAGAVNLLHPETNDLVTLVAGDSVPDWAEDRVTNPDLFAEKETPSTASEPAPPAGAQQAAPGSTPPAVDGTVAELKARAKELGIAQSGSKAELIERITAKLTADAAQAESTNEPAGSDGSASSDAVTAGGSDTERTALEQRAEELGITVEAEWSDEELRTVIEDAEQE